jgi:hypothetical protein
MGTQRVLGEESMRWPLGCGSAAQSNLHLLLRPVMERALDHLRFFALQLFTAPLLINPSRMLEHGVKWSVYPSLSKALEAFLARERSLDRC